MRIIAGYLKSRKLDFPRDSSVRPMTDRMRETLFNILGTSVINAQVLDIFSGSGSIGIEALSRGARRVIFVDQNPGALKIIRKNLAALSLEDKAALICSDAVRAVSDLESDRQTFDIVFTDPPYDKGFMKKILLRLDQSDILPHHVKVVCHHSAHEELPSTLNCLLAERSEKIGQARLSFLIKTATTA